MESQNSTTPKPKNWKLILFPSLGLALLLAIGGLVAWKTEIFSGKDKDKTSGGGGGGGDGGKITPPPLKENNKGLSEEELTQKAKALLKADIRTVASKVLDPMLLARLENEELQTLHVNIQKVKFAEYSKEATAQGNNGSLLTTVLGFDSSKPFLKEWLSKGLPYYNSPYLEQILSSDLDHQNVGQIFSGIYPPISALKKDTGDAADNLEAALAFFMEQSTCNNPSPEMKKVILKFCAINKEEDVQELVESFKVHKDLISAARNSLGHLKETEAVPNRFYLQLAKALPPKSE